MINAKVTEVHSGVVDKDGCLIYLQIPAMIHDGQIRPVAGT